MERDEAELPGMARHPGDRHAARMEERAEPREGLGVAALGRQHRGRRRLAELDERVDRDRPPARHDQRVQIDARDVGPLDRDAREREQHVGERLAIHRRLAAEGVEEVRGRDPSGRAQRLLARER